MGMNRSSSPLRWWISGMCGCGELPEGGRGRQRAASGAQHAEAHEHQPSACRRRASHLILLVGTQAKRGPGDSGRAPPKDRFPTAPTAASSRGVQNQGVNGGKARKSRGERIVTT